MVFDVTSSRTGASYGTSARDRDYTYWRSIEPLLSRPAIVQTYHQLRAIQIDPANQPRQTSNIYQHTTQRDSVSLEFEPRHQYYGARKGVAKTPISSHV